MSIWLGLEANGYLTEENCYAWVNWEVFLGYSLKKQNDIHTRIYTFGCIDVTTHKYYISLFYYIY